MYIVVYRGKVTFNKHIIKKIKFNVTCFKKDNYEKLKDLIIGQGRFHQISDV